MFKVARKTAAYCKLCCLIRCKVLESTPTNISSAQGPEVHYIRKKAGGGRGLGEGELGHWASADHGKASKQRTSDKADADLA